VYLQSCDRIEGDVSGLACKKSGDYVRAFAFSNEIGSNKSSLGLFRVTEVYQGEHGTSLRLKGLDPGVNDNAEERAIVVHGAEYVSLGSVFENILQRRGPGVGRSLGCPVVSFTALDDVVTNLRVGGYLFVHYK
jgi:hypothetical protein